jgi:hypothetical protein
MNCMDDPCVVDPARVDRRDGQVGVLAELPLDDEQRHPFA